MDNPLSINDKLTISLTNKGMTKSFHINKTITHRSEMLKTIVRVIFVILGVARGGVILPKHHVA